MQSLYANIKLLPAVGAAFTVLVVHHFDGQSNKHFIILTDFFVDVDFFL